MEAEEFYALDEAEQERLFNEAKAEELSSETEYEEVHQDEMDEYEEEVDYDEEVEDLEQPDEQDSDDDTSSEVEDEDEVIEDSEDEDSTLDEGTDETEEQPEVIDEPAKVNEQPVHKFKANGKEYEFTEDEIKSQFPLIFGQAMDYTKKMQAMKPWRQQIDALEQNEISPEQLNLAIDVLKGDKDAITEILKRTGVDALDLDIENSRYVAKNYGRDDTVLAVKDVVDQISSDPEYDMTFKVLNNEWDERSWKEMSSNPEMIRLLHIDVKNGMYNKVQPIAEKLKVYGRGVKSDLDYYEEAARIYFAQQEQNNVRLANTERVNAEQTQREAEKAKIAQVQAKQQKAKAVKQESMKRKAAAPAKKVAGTRKVSDYLDMSEEGFEEFYNNLPDL